MFLKMTVEIKCSYDELVPINQLIPNPRNPNQHSDEQIRLLEKLIAYQGLRWPVIVSKLSGLIAAGHGRLMALQRLGVREVPVNYQEFVDEAQEHAFMISDNKIQELAESDPMRIQEIALDLGPDFDFDLLGIPDFKVVGVDTLPPGEEDAVPEPPKEAITKPGDLWILGEHRLLCGDSTNIQHVERLMDGEKADMVFTDPPYGISFESKNIGGWGKDTSGRQIKNDNSTNMAREAWQIISTFSCPTIIWGGNYFTDFLPVNGKWYVWNKLAFDKPNQNFSHCELAWTNIAGNQVEMFSHVWDGAFRAGNKKDECDSRIHSNQKPVALVEKMLTDNAILDLFGGSGSTLIACEKTKRKCFMMEIDPIYCDVIVARWEQYSGGKASLEKA